MLSSNPSNLPSRLWRYFPLVTKDKTGGALALLERNQLWLSSIAYFNDPFDVLPRYDAYTQEKTDQLLSKEFAFSSPEKYPTYQKFQAAKEPTRRVMMDRAQLMYPKKFRDEFSKTFGVVCFSAVGTDVLMWSHYADSHRGIAVEFDATIPNIQKLLLEIHYDDSRPHIHAATDLEILGRKSKRWAYEKEYRLISTLFDCPRDPESQRHYISINPQNITKVYLGWLSIHSDSGQERVSRILRTILSSDLRHVEVSAVWPKPDAYELEPHVLPRSDLEIMLDRFSHGPPPH